MNLSRLGFALMLVSIGCFLMSFALSLAAPVVYQLEDCEGQAYRHKDAAYLRAWIAGRNGALPMPDLLPPHRHPFRDTMSCACVGRDGYCPCGGGKLVRPVERLMSPPRTITSTPSKQPP